MGRRGRPPGGRGPGPRGRGRGRAKVTSDSPDEDIEAFENDNAAAPVLVEFVSQSVMKRLKKSLNTSDKDQEEAVCAECGQASTYRDFRFHNIMYHLNTALTLDEKHDGSTVADHKYYARKLNEFKKWTNAVVFSCPRPNCTSSSFKSTLGLAHHLVTCGRTEEELAAVLVDCEICHAKFTLPQLQHHKKTHENKTLVRERVPVEPENDDSVKTLGGKSRRRCAMKARKSFQKHGESSESDKDDGDDDSDDGADDLTHFEEPEERRERKKPSFSAKPVQPGKESNDFYNYACKFLDSLDSEGKVWDEPVRNGEDFFIEEDNSLQSLDPSEIDSYMPNHKQSVEFKFVSKANTSDYHRLDWFEGETVSSSSSVSSSVHHAGGQVLSISWHPSGKLFAVSVGKDWTEDIDLMKQQSRHSCVQIYSNALGSVSLQLVIGISFGYANYIQWSTFCPDIMNSYKPHAKSCFEDIEIFFRAGYLAMACEDSTIRIMSFRIEDLKLPPNYEYKPGLKIKVYTKTPEICLKLNDSTVDDDTGNVSKFDWHEKNQYLAAGYANGTIAVFDLQAKSKLLVEKSISGGNKVTVMYPFWTFSGHRLAVRGICFDPSNPRYFVTAGQDRCIKTWDTFTRMERESKRGGIAVDMCWIRGWIHQALSFECHISYQSSMHNYVRIMPVGSTVGRPTCPEIHNFTSLDFHRGLTAQGTDGGKVYLTYYDWFWRECDYDRNRKKKNVVVLSQASVDKTSYSEISKTDFSVELRKLKKSVYSSKTFQKLGIDEEEGVYSVTLEARFGGPHIYDPLPKVDNVEEESRAEVKISKKSTETDQTTEQETDLVVVDSINAISEPKSKDGLLPVFDVNIREENPRIILSFMRQRPNGSVAVESLNDAKFEEHTRFQPFIRINKVSWSPDGKILAVGYRNGLITLIPASFEATFS